MSIQIARNDPEIIACHSVMQELRPHIGADQFVLRVRRQESQGFRLAYLTADGNVVAVAGFRIGENLAWGRFLYVDDLVTASAYRSAGHGATMMAWLRCYAVENGCDQLHLDSGLQRVDAHRFYAREHVIATGYHFAENLLVSPEASGRAGTQASPFCYAVIFTSRRREGDHGYADMARRMEALARTQPGFIGIESAHESSLGITISYWRDLESIHAWRRQVEHREAQRLGKERWYSDYRIQVARVERESVHASD